jgi:hypothetical protein
MLCADSTIIGGTLAFGGGMVVEGGQVQRRGVKEGGRRDELAPANDGSEVYPPHKVHDRCHCRPHSSIT